MAVVNPAIIPKIRNNTPVPSRRSSQYPMAGGTTISNEVVVIRDVHSIAKAKGERPSRCSFTGD
jgi:hypothetical protein